MRFAGFIGPGYEMQSKNVDCQRTVNMFTELNALGTGKEREVACLVPTPGLRLLATLPKNECRGLWSASNGEAYAVYNDKFYQISSSWAATELGTLNTDTGPVSMADNGIHLVIVDGVDGFVWNMSTDSFSEIVDIDFYPADQVSFLDGYFIFNRTGTQQFFISGINDVTFDGLDIGSAEGSPDNLIGVQTTNQNLYLPSTKSIEVYYNSGDADFPFSRVQGAVIDVGVTAPFSVAKIGGLIFFLGGDNSGTGVVYKLQGYQAQRISTTAIESVIRGLTSDERAEATAYTYQQGGHLFYCLNLPGVDSTFVYDVTTEFWHERTYLNLWSEERHRSQYHMVAHGLNVVGDYENGKLYALDPDYYTDATNSVPRYRVAPHLTQGLKLVRHNRFELDMETGVGLDGTGQGTDPVVMLSYSDDGGHTWSNERQGNIGKIGQKKKRIYWNRLGMSRDRVYKVKITDPVKVVLIGAELDLEAGVS